MSGMRLTSRTRPRTHPGRLSEDRGSSIAEFAMVSVLLVFLLFAVLQPELGHGRPRLAREARVSGDSWGS
jgi:hypothetical protein